MMPVLVATLLAGYFLFLPNTFQELAKSVMMFCAFAANHYFLSETGYFAFVDRIRERRFPVIDPERGLVFAFAFFDHSGTVRDYSLTDGTPIRSAVERPFSWMIAEAFRIERGMITRIEALMTECPYGMRSGWPA